MTPPVQLYGTIGSTTWTFEPDATLPPNTLRVHPEALIRLVTPSARPPAPAATPAKAKTPVRRNTVKRQSTVTYEPLTPTQRTQLAELKVPSEVKYIAERLFVERASGVKVARELKLSTQSVNYHRRRLEKALGVKRLPWKRQAA